jgi:cytochrome c biogenesis protein CcdA
MADVILQLIPLALGAISPVLILLIVLFLTSKGGMTKSLAFIAGKYLTYVVWGLVFLGLMDKVSATGEASTASLVIKIILGGLLLILAIKTFLGEDDPDAPPPKLLTTLDKMGPGKLFLVGSLLSIIQIRFVALVLAGVVIIATAQMSAGQNVLAILLLSPIDGLAVADPSGCFPGDG